MDAGLSYRLRDALLCVDMAKRQFVPLPADTILVLEEMRRDGMARLSFDGRSLLAFALDLEGRSDPLEGRFSIRANWLPGGAANGSAS